MTKYLLSADILANGIVPTMQDGVVSNWLEMLNETDQLDFTTFVPGHCSLMRIDQVKAQHRAIEKF